MNGDNDKHVGVNDFLVLIDDLASKPAKLERSYGCLLNAFSLNNSAFQAQRLTVANVTSVTP